MLVREKKESTYTWGTGWSKGKGIIDGLKSQSMGTEAIGLGEKPLHLNIEKKVLEKKI